MCHVSLHVSSRHPRRAPQLKQVWGKASAASGISAELRDHFYSQHFKSQMSDMSVMLNKRDRKVRRIQQQLRSNNFAPTFK
ncbi:hypothetical protein Q7C36_005238 [Tachysurus vachellii]|uniref:Uncharacterized protein n=1 Tax=Tachysurus vachellii TaxID=175792 RepID=A0AA88NQM6_TACVA|nr:hypothetical protein Q7C36_005238 [Tachysurus vachellii]